MAKCGCCELTISLVLHAVPSLPDYVRYNHCVSFHCSSCLRLPPHTNHYNFNSLNSHKSLSGYVGCLQIVSQVSKEIRNSWLLSAVAVISVQRLTSRSITRPSVWIVKHKTVPPCKIRDEKWVIHVGYIDWKCQRVFLHSCRQTIASKWNLFYHLWSWLRLSRLWWFSTAALCLLSNDSLQTKWVTVFGYIRRLPSIIDDGLMHFDLIKKINLQWGWILERPYHQPRLT